MQVRNGRFYVGWGSDHNYVRVTNLDDTPTLGGHRPNIESMGFMVKDLEDLIDVLQMTKEQMVWTTKDTVDLC